MKHFLLLLLTILSITSATIQAQEKPDLKAKAILDDLSTKTKSYSTIRAEFTFTVEGRDKKSETQSGILQLKGDKYKLEIKGQEIISDNKTVWTFLKDANEVQVNNVDMTSADAVNPSTIFTIYEKGFKYKFDKEEMQGNTTLQIIDLYPLNPDKKKFHTVKLLIDKSKKQIAVVKIFMKDGSVVTYNVKIFTPNAEIKDTTFAFDAKAHPGVEVVDLRD